MHTATSANAALPVIDLSAVASLSADELTAQIALADTVFARVKMNDPRRSSLAYSDAKMAVQVLTAERRRREEAAAIAAAELIVAEAAADLCPASCKAALSHVSLCECRTRRGEFHGADHRASRQRFAAAQATRTDYVQPGFTRHMLAQLDDEEELPAVPADVRRARLAALDPEDAF